MTEGISGTMTDLYDVFIDWEGRLGREMPGLTRALGGARRVLDVGCGTGRHVAALLNEGYDAHGTDVSADMLTKAREFTGEPDRFFAWRLGDAPPDVEPFDAIICLGNVWPQVTGDDDVERAARAMRTLLAPGGRLVMGLKALAIRRETKNPYMPLMRREHEGRPLWFIRFVDFSGPKPLATFHMTVVGGDDECLVHKARPVRVWDPDGLRATLLGAGMSEVAVSGRLGDPDAPVTGEDVFVHAIA